MVLQIEIGKSALKLYNFSTNSFLLFTKRLAVLQNRCGKKIDR